MLPFETSQNRIVWSYPPVTSSVLARDIAPKAPCTSCSTSVRRVRGPQSLFVVAATWWRGRIAATARCS